MIDSFNHIGNMVECWDLSNSLFNMWNIDYSLSGNWDHFCVGFDVLSVDGDVVDNVLYAMDGSGNWNSGSDSSGDWYLSSDGSGNWVN